MFPNQPVASLEEITAPVVELNKIAIGYTEKLVEMNLSMLRKQSDLLLGGWREVLAAKDPQHVQQYLARQGEAARDLVNEFIAEAKVITELNQEVANDMRKVVEANLAKLAKLPT